MSNTFDRYVIAVMIVYKIPVAFAIMSLLFVVSGAGTLTPSYTKKELFSAIVKVNDHNIPTALSRQSVENGKEYYGAVFDADSVVSPIGTAQLVQTLICGYVTPESRFFNSPEILRRMELASAALINLQHDDGTIDLLTTNFHSTPDLGFTIFPLAISYSIMIKTPRLGFGKVPSLIKQYFIKAGDALSVGGIHTPNHRWVVSAALSWLYSFFPEPRYKSRIDQWLAEKIDIDPDGQYNERSTAVYTPVTNRSLLDIAKRMQYDGLYDVVRKNLNLTIYLVHSNGEIATESSNRQDQYLQRNMAGYYLAYNYLAIKDRDTRYAGMVRYIERTVPVEHLAYMLPLFIEDPTLMEDLRDTTAIPTQYHQHFKFSDMVRIREGVVDMSIITNNPTFFTYFKGEAALEGVRLSAAFFGKGQFQSQTMERQGDTYILSSTLSGPYYQPLPKDKIPPDTDAWTGVPRSERQQSEIQTLHTRIFVTQRNGKATIKISVEGPKNLPVTLELGFREGGILQNADPKEGIENAFLVKNQEYATYQRGADMITIGPGVASHKWTQLRGALPKMQAKCLYFTDYAPCAFQFTIE